jgi:photosystem II stability/assembly factor-like uncharacterized protein
MFPPALQSQNRNVPQGRSLHVSGPPRGEAVRFLDRDGHDAAPGTEGRVQCDQKGIRVQLACREPEPGRLIAAVPPQDPLSPKERAYWDGDLVPLARMLLGASRWPENMAWTRQLTRPASVLLDDCVIVFLTPVAAGEDRSYLAPVSFAPAPAKLAVQLRPRTNNPVFLEGAFYFLAVNPKGALLDAFFDPWGGGIVCPAWHSGATVAARINSNQWTAEIFIPYSALKPNVSRDSVWGVDLCRIRRCGLPTGQVTRSRQTTMIHYDLPSPSLVFPQPGPVPSIVVGALDNPCPAGAFPSEAQWRRAAVIDALRGNHSGRTYAHTEVRLVHDRQRLFIRFACRRNGSEPWKVVTPEQEEKEYGPGNRRCNFLDRRESYGLDWGDYVEVLLATDRQQADPFHAGLFQFAVNVQGRLLERYYDTFGMFTVSPHPPWISGTEVRSVQGDGMWTAVLAIPFCVLCSDSMPPTTWGLNLHRGVSGDSAIERSSAQVWLWGKEGGGKPRLPVFGGERDFCWSPTHGLIRDVRRLGAMHIDPGKPPATAVSNHPGSAPARPHLPAPKPLNRLKHSDRVASVCFVDKRHGWAVGGRGLILHTCDGGETWAEQQSGTDFILERVFFRDRQHGWVVGGWPRDPAVALFGGMGIILATSDGGQTWRPQLDSKATWLSDVFFLDDQLGWAVGEYGSVLRTTDGGRTWTQVRRVPTPVWLSSVRFIDARRGWAVGDYATILRSEDGGLSWTEQEAPSPRRPFGWPLAYRSVRFSGTRRGWIVGDHGNILHSGDGGRTWTQDELSLSDKSRELANFTDLSLTPRGTAWAISPVGPFRCPPGETRWIPMRSGTGAWLSGGCFADEDHGFLVGQRGAVLRTDDGGRSWRLARHSPRPMGLLYASPHDHHLNGSAIGPLGEDRDAAYVLLGRPLGEFALGGNHTDKAVEAAALCLGVPVVYAFREFNWRERDNPHRIAERYQHHGGLESIERRLVALIRALRPPILVAEQPVVQEGYYAHGVGDVARAVMAAFDSAGDASRFPELGELGLQPFTPAKLYLVTIWANELYGIHPPTVRISPADRFSPRLGMTYGEAGRISRQAFWGLLDRNEPPSRHKPWPGAWNLHLKKSRVPAPSRETDVWHGIS